MLLRGRFSLLVSFILLASVVGCQGGNSTLTPAPVVHATAVATASAAPTASATPLATGTATASPVPTATASATASAGPTPTATPTANPSATPVVTSISPTSGPVGTTVTINGSGFDEAYQIEFTGGVYGDNGYINSDNMIVVMVPAGAMTGPITIISHNGTTMSGTFTVTP